MNVKLRTLEYITLYLRNRQSGNLRAIESCVCSIRSIERNMMSFLRTVYSGHQSGKAPYHSLPLLRLYIYISLQYSTYMFVPWWELRTNGPIYREQGGDYHPYRKGIGKTVKIVLTFFFPTTIPSRDSVTRFFASDFFINHLPPSP